MPTNASDVRVTRTRAALVAAVEDVLEQGSWSDLTIAGLCARAGISRPTFYQHVASLEDLLGATIRHRLDQARATTCDAARGPEVLAAALTRLDGERQEYACLSAHPPVYAQVQAAFQDWLAERVRADFPEADDVTIAYVVGGTARVMGRWLATDAERPSPEELARTLWRLNHAILDLPE